MIVVIIIVVAVTLWQSYSCKSFWSSIANTMHLTLTSIVAKLLVVIIYMH